MAQKRCGNKRPPREGLRTYLAVGLLAIGFAAAMAASQAIDYAATVWLGEHRWPALVDVMGRSLFEGEGIGGGDPVVLFLLAAVAGYYWGWKKPGGRLHRFRPHLGLIVSSAVVWGLGLVHTLKWTVGRARPREVIYGDAPFSAWYDVGPHFVTEGIYRGSFPSGHTAQAALLLALAYVLAGAVQRRTGLQWAAWGWAGLCLCFASTMGAARCMSLSHWLTDVTAGLFLTWLGIHVSYRWILRVPGQAAFFRRTGRWPAGPDAWELRLSAWLLGVLAGAGALAIGARALVRPEAGALLLLAPVGAAAAAVCLRRARSIRRRALAEMDGPRP